MEKIVTRQAALVSTLGALVCLCAGLAAAQAPQTTSAAPVVQPAQAPVPSTVIQPPSVPLVVKPPVIDLPDPVKSIAPPPGGQPGAPAMDLVATFDPLWLIGHSDGILKQNHIEGHISPDLAGYGIVVSPGDQVRAATVLQADAKAIGYPLHLDSDSTIEIERDDSLWLVHHIANLLTSNGIGGSVDQVQFTVSVAPADVARAKTLLKADSTKIGYTIFFF